MVNRVLFTEATVFSGSQYKSQNGQRKNSNVNYNIRYTKSSLILEIMCCLIE